MSQAAIPDLHFFLANVVGATDDFQKPFSFNVLCSEMSEPSPGELVIVSTIHAKNMGDFASMLDFEVISHEMDIVKVMMPDDFTDMMRELVKTSARQLIAKEMVDMMSRLNSEDTTPRHFTEILELSPLKRVAVGEVKFTKRTLH